MSRVRRYEQSASLWLLMSFALRTASLAMAAMVLGAAISRNAPLAVAAAMAAVAIWFGADRAAALAHYWRVRAARETALVDHERKLLLITR